MNESQIRASLGQLDVALHCFDSADSTNLLAKRWAREGGSLPAAFIADAQTAGRGRLGRTFISPQGGLYMSLALDCAGAHPGTLTTLAAATVLRAADTMGLPPLQIKWVNDLMQHGKKVGGILSEGLTIAQGGIKQAVIGIGINTGGASFSRDLADKASCLDWGDKPIDREILAALIISGLLEALPRAPEHMSFYRARCLTIGQDIRFETEGRTIYGRAVSVKDDGTLIVHSASGILEIAAGEVSVRGASGEYV